MEFVREEIAVTKAWVLCSAVILVIAYLPVPDGQTQVEFGFISVLLTLFISALSFVILRFFAGKYRDSRKPPYKKEPIGAWGYSWRFLVAYFISGSFGLIPIVLIADEGLFPAEILGPIVLLVLFSMFCIAFYCPNRKERLARLKTLLMPSSA